MHFPLRSLIVTAILCVIGHDVLALDPYSGNDPYWVLLHEPAVIQELKLASKQRQEYVDLLDEMDLRFFPLRNKSQNEAVAGMSQISKDVRKQLKLLLRPSQENRISEILLQHLGASAILQDDVSNRLDISPAQKKRIKEILAESETATAAIVSEAADGGIQESHQKRYKKLKADEQKKIMAGLKPEQREAIKNLYGTPFAINTLQKPAFKVPELIDTGEWINSSPLQLGQMRGKVVVVHFYACGCSNCIHNYPWYRQWHDQFKDQNVTLIGIHSPETSSERESANVRRKAADEKLEFPILIDGKSENWNAWGNSMWPSVYLIDKQGYLREFWPGELKWKGNDGEKFLRERIEDLLKEP